MADLTITKADVQIVSGKSRVGTGGEAITAGQVVYKKTADLKYWLAQNDVDAASADAEGIALNDAAADQPVSFVPLDEGNVVDIGATMTIGETYIVSATPGAIAPIGDISTNYVTHLGVAITANNLQLRKNASGVQHA